ncbi:MAG: NACHT domain-containing protein, partial [Okeania sp. SIO2D1]|nr:NACHT domain-containing protein [Okeania sp. SIO2D1]
MNLKEWQDICREMLNNQLTSNSLFHDDEEAKKHREQIYVPLALVERKKSETRQQDELSPEQGTKLYEPQYEEKQRFTHNTFLKEILQQKLGKSQGKRISLIGEPGAGKTTLLQTIANWILEQGLGLPVWVSLADLTQDGNLRSFEDYLLNSWLPFSPDQRQKVGENFTEQFERGRVWLLLDGVDEIATSGSQTLQNISRQLSGWLGKVWVVLTCRLNVWQADVNALSDFETFRLLDFDYPQQVEQFIDNWFDPPQPPLLRGEQEDPQPSERGEQEQDFVRGENSKGDRLKVELGKEEKARVRDLVQNPLRLALLCRSWQLYEGSLPETKAELYGQFVEQFYRWKCVIFPIKESKQRELNLALGRLAKDDIDSSGSRFRLREDFIEKRLGDADDENSLFYLALQIGWLNNVGVAAESPMKKVYAFFHATFEEYFAALAIADWDFFLPRKHKNKPVKGRRYRIFEPQWKQVILLWLGRGNVEDEKKEEFIKALTKFKDRCKHFLPKEKLDRGFYEYQAYFLAAAGVGEFSKCTKTDKIVEKIVDWDCHNRSYDQIHSAARSILLETPRKNTINALVPILESTTDNSTSWQAAYILGNIDPGNEKAIHALVQILESTTDNSTLEGVAQTLGKIGKGNKKATDALVQLLASTSDSYIRRQAAESLGEIGTGNEKAINDLVQLLESTSDNYIRSLVAESLGKINPGNEKAIHALVQLLDSTTDYTRSLAAESLGKIDPGNEKTIHALVQLLDSTINFTITGSLVAENLEKIGKGNEKAIHALVQLLDSTTDDSTRRQAAYILGNIDPGNEKAIHAL